MAHWRVGVDVGGTFTDFAALNTETGALLVEKTPTTPHNPAGGIIAGLELLLERGVAAEAISSFLHGTTITTNALIEMRGVPVGLLLTAGLRGVAEVQSGLRYGPLTDLTYRRPLPLAPAELTFEIGERVDARGEVIQALDEDAVRRAGRALRTAGITSIAVSYLFSYANPAHEQRSKAILEEEVPGAYISASCEILPRIREWPRMSGTLLNAYLEPLLLEYISTLRDELRGHGVRTEQLYLMQSNGGIMPFTAVLAGGKTIHTLLSGPAAGVKAGARLAALDDLGSLITIDIGGTSCDIAFIERGQPLEVTDSEIAQRELSVPMLDVTAIGAGGGTVAWLDAAGGLNLGPQSAGAVPGPVCYGHGGEKPTITDANVVLGYLNPEYFLGGRLRLDREAAADAIRERIGKPLALEAVEAAHAMVQIINTRMADKIRILASQRAITLPDFTLVAGGGAGAVHAAAVADELGLRRVVSPPNPGAFSALGLLCTDVVRDYVQSEVRLLCSTGIDHVQAIFDSLEERARRDLRQEGFGTDVLPRLIREIDVRYAGQGFELRVPVSSGPLHDTEKATVTSLFNDLHHRLRGHSAAGEPLEIVSYRLRAEVAVPQYEPQPAANPPCATPAAEACVGTRVVSFGRGEAAHLARIWRREQLTFGNVLDGPAIVEQVDATTVIPPGWSARLDAYGNLILEYGGRQ
ncbi:MAG TPA: hydantoinase/oxoprolinase family protein [Chloroflexota bacterium]|jgi:N-methylhydantoinase A|nr:hydantoinase/oxoprolinase family protein [Chloroflexota bacterium]